MDLLCNVTINSSMCANWMYNRARLTFYWCNYENSPHLSILNLQCATTRVNVSSIEGGLSPLCTLNRIEFHHSLDSIFPEDHNPLHWTAIVANGIQDILQRRGKKQKL